MKDNYEKEWSPNEAPPEKLKVKILATNDLKVVNLSISRNGKIIFTSQYCNIDKNTLTILKEYDKIDLEIEEREE